MSRRRICRIPVRKMFGVRDLLLTAVAIAFSTMVGLQHYRITILETRLSMVEGHAPPRSAGAILGDFMSPLPSAKWQQPESLPGAIPREFNGLRYYLFPLKSTP